MAQQKSTKSQEYDSIVIGGGLTGLIIAHHLEGTGRRVGLIEALDTLGGNCRPYQSAIGTIDHGFKFFPATPAAREALEWMESVLGQSLGIEEIEAPPVTYDNGRFQPFVGFGDFSPEAASELDYFSSPKRLVTSLTPKDWVKILSETFTGDVLLQSHVTRLHFDDGFIIEATVNGTKRFSAREYVFCATPQALAPILPDEACSTRQRARLSKGQFFTAIGLDICHGTPVTDSHSLHVLKGANEEPLVGVFHPPTARESVRESNSPGQPSPVQLSQWLTFVRADMTDDNETTATALKKIKRQLKRAYETALENVVFERILVQPSSHGEISGLLNDDQRWPKLDNLWVANSFFHPNRNLIGTLGQCRRVLEAMGEMRLDTDLNETKTPGPSLSV